MKKLLFYLIIFKFNVSFSETVVIPENLVDTKIYLQNCEKTGYRCIHLFLAQKIVSEETPLFNSLIEDLDLISEEYRKTVTSKIQQILKQEMISLDQLQVLLQVIHKTESLEKNAKLDFLKNEIQQIWTTLSHLDETREDFITYIVFKKKLTQKQFTQVFSQVRQFQYYRIDPYSFAQKNFSTQFLTGNCQNSQIAAILFDRFSIGQTLPLYKTECTFTAEIQKSLHKASNFAAENKTPIIWLAIATTVAVLFTQKYDVEFK